MPTRDPRKATTGGSLGLALIGLIMVGALYANWSTKRTLNTLQAVDTMRQVRLELERASVGMVNAETAERGYLLSGKDAFLDIFEPNLRSAGHSLAVLREMTREDPDQQHRLDRLEPMVSDQISSMRGQLSVRKTSGLEAAATTVANEEGKKMMDRIRAVIREMEDAEDAALSERSEAARWASHMTLFVIMAGSVVALGLVALAAWAIQRDEATRRDAEQAMDRARTYAESIVDTVREPLVVLDRDLCVASANRSFYEVFGGSPQETEGRALVKLGAGAWDDPRLRTRLEEDALDSEGRFDDLEVERDFPGLGSRTMLLNGRKLDRPGHRSGAVLLAIEDITERKFAEAELRKSTEEIYDLYNHAPCGYHSLDADELIVRMNETELHWLGYEAEEVVGHLHFPDLLTPASRQVFADQFPRFLKDVLIGGLELEMLRKDGSHMVVLLNATALKDETGRCLASRSTIFDITARKIAEKKVHELNDELEHRANLLEAANKELEAFSYSVSHDLRAPLRHIDGFADMLGKHAGEALDPTGQRYLKTISTSAKRMGTLIDDLLVFSRIGRAEMRRMNVDLNAVAREAIAEVQQDAGDRKIVWKHQPLPVVTGDPALLRQVFVNLISNAVKYSRPRNPSVIEIGTVNGAPAETVVYVRDNGVGFEMAYADKLFGVFQRLHRADEFEGTGIGLANVRRVVSRHGGRTWAEGRLGEGATFYFSIPIA
jgi:PAS domain S-box-containing protein